LFTCGQTLPWDSAVLIILILNGKSVVLLTAGYRQLAFASEYRMFEKEF
jgi:hypothetical protein